MSLILDGNLKIGAHVQREIEIDVLFEIGRNSILKDASFRTGVCNVFLVTI